MNNKVLGWVVLLAGVVLLMAEGVDAGFECEKHWAGPSKDNSLADCDLAASWGSRTLRLVSFGIPALFMLWVMLCYPIAWCGRQNPCCKCCGTNRRRPVNFCCGGSEWDDQSPEVKEEQYTYGEVQRTKACTGILWLLGMVCLCLMILGSSMMGDAYDGFWVEMYDLVDWAESQIGNIRSTVTVNQTLMPGIPETAFTTALNETAVLRVNITKAEASANDYVDQAALVAFGVGVFPVVLLVLGTLFAVCDIRSCGPASLTCCYALFILVYGVLAIIFMFVGMMTEDVCDEIDLHLEGKPGIFQWWIEPICNDTINLEQIKADVADAEKTNSVSGCEQFTSICSPTTTWVSSSPSKVYQCEIVNAESDCPDYSSFSEVYLNSYPKAGLPFQMCASSTDNTLCGPANCSVDCVDEDNKLAAISTLGFLDYADRALTAFHTYVLPLVSCNNLLTQALQTFGQCRSLAKAFVLMGSGATCYAFIFCVGICNQMRGQKRFFKKADPNAKVYADEDDFDALAEATVSNTVKEARRRSGSRSGTPSRGSPTSPGGNGEPYNTSYPTSPAGPPAMV